MRFAVIADIHGNRLALEAVLEDIAEQGVDAVLNLGDHVSGPLDPRGVVDILMGLQGPVIAGNHDRWLKENTPDRFKAVDQLVARMLEQQHKDWISALPATQVFEREVFLCHGTPRNDNKVWLDAFYYDRKTTLPDESTVAAEAEGFEYPVLLCGHTHLAHTVRLRDGRLIVNPGSVGLQFIHGSPDARYAIVERRRGKWSVTFRIIGYDHEGAAGQAEANGFGHWRDALVSGWSAPDKLF